MRSTSIKFDGYEVDGTVFLIYNDDLVKHEDFARFSPHGYMYRVRYGEPLNRQAFEHVLNYWPLYDEYWQAYEEQKLSKLPDPEKLYPKPWQTYGPEPNPVNALEAACYVSSNDNTHAPAQIPAAGNSFRDSSSQGVGTQNISMASIQNPLAAASTFNAAPSGEHPIYSNLTYATANTSVSFGNPPYFAPPMQAMHQFQQPHAPAFSPYATQPNQQRTITNPYHNPTNIFSTGTSAAVPVGGGHQLMLPQKTIIQQVGGHAGTGQQPSGQQRTVHQRNRVVLRTNVIASNGDPAQAVVAQAKGYIREHPPYLGWLDIIGAKWQEAGGPTGNDFFDGSIVYSIDRLPRNFTMWSRLAPDGRTHYYVYGHPRGRFDSAKRFAPHFVHLMRYNGGNLGACPCDLCP